MKIIIWIAAILLTFTNCNQPKEKTEEAAAPKSIFNEQLNDPAYILLKNNCLICHGGGSSHDAMIAPPMFAIKKHYIDDETTKESFVNDIVSWIPNPKEENTRMPGAIRNYNLMPPLNLPEEDLKAIATFIYENDMDKPEWFDEHEKEMKGKGMGKGKGKGKGKKGM